jgi:hypothetical protein
LASPIALENINCPCSIEKYFSSAGMFTQPARIMANREKRGARLVAWVPHTLREQYELFVAERGNVISMSDYLLGVLEEHAINREAMKIVKQKIGRRIGNQ